MKFHTIPINAGEFLARTGGMSASDFGAHTRLYIRHFQVGECGLLDDDRELARVCGLSTRSFQKSKASILRGFINKKGNNASFWIMPEVVLELKDAQQKSEKNRSNSLKRWKSQDANALPTQSDGNAIQYPTSNINNKSRDIIPKSGVFTQPKEKWKADMLNIVGEAAYNAWFQDLTVQEGFVVCPTASVMNFIQQYHEFDIKKSIGDEFQGFKTIP